MIWFVLACFLAVSSVRGARVLEQWSEEAMAGAAASCTPVTSALEIYNYTSSLQSGAEQAFCIASGAPECVTALADRVCIQRMRQT